MPDNDDERRKHQQQDGNALFTVEAKSARSGLKVQFKKRFSDFVDLHQRVQAAFAGTHLSKCAVSQSVALLLLFRPSSCDGNIHTYIHTCGEIPRSLARSLARRSFSPACVRVRVRVRVCARACVCVW